MTSSENAPNTGRDDAAAPGSSDRRRAGRPVTPVPPPADDAPFGAGLVEDTPPPDANAAALEAVGDRPLRAEHDADGWEAVPDEQMLDEVGDDASDSDLEDADASPAGDDGGDDRPPWSRGRRDGREGDRASAAPAAPPDEPAIGIDDDAPAAPSEAQSAATAGRPVRDTWDPAATPRHLAVELKRIEARIQELLEGIDPRRKRRLEGTRRWLELQDDIAAIRFDGRIDEGRVREINALCAKRHRLFRHLNFLVATRPTWNT